MDKIKEEGDILAFMRDEVSKDDNWRVQEVLAKAFDEFCKKTGYEKALPIIPAPPVTRIVLVMIFSFS